MVAIITSFESTDLYVADRKSFEDFVVFELNPSVCHDIDSVVSLYEDEEDDPSPSPTSRSKMSSDQLRNVRLWEKRQDRRRKKRLWAQRQELPVGIVNGRKSGTIALRSHGDSDNGDDTYFGDQAIRRICRFLPNEGIFGFRHSQLPSNDTTEPGGISFWVYDHGTTTARASRDWTDEEITTNNFRAPSLIEFMRYYRRSSTLRLVGREG